MDPKLQQIADFLATVSVEEDRVDHETFSNSERELRDYRVSHARRFLRSLQLIERWRPTDRPLRVLELGAAPYYFTALLQRFVECDVTGANVQATVWPGQPGINRETTVRLRVGLDQQVQDIPVHVLNLEKDPYPFPDAHFDLVLCMEIIEHLVYSPTHMLAEAHRVLRPGGRFLLSTPNAVDVRRTLAPLLNRSSAFHYSGYGVYGRHNREFTVDELELLCEACGYRVLEKHVENIFIRTHYTPARQLAFRVLNLLSSLPLPYLRAKREYIFLVAESLGEAQWAYPERLYFYPDLYPTGPGDA